PGPRRTGAGTQDRGTQVVRVHRMWRVPPRGEGRATVQTMTREEYEAAFVEATRRAAAKDAYRESHREWAERLSGRARAEHVAAVCPAPQPVRRCTGCGAWEHLERPCVCGGRRRR